MDNTSNAINLKKEILVRLIRAFFSENFEKNIRLIPFDMRPKSAEVPYRCCIYKERAILKDRVIAGLGFAIEDDDETISLTEYAQRALQRQDLEKEPLTVLGAACKGCVPKRVYVTELCQGCVARPCENACKHGAISIVNGRSVIDSTKCKACKMCVSACPYNAIVKLAVPCEDNCPVNAIIKNEDGTACIDFTKCIFCGKCVYHCPFGAVHEKSQLIDVLRLVKENKETVVVFAPAVASQFSASIEKLKEAIKAIGFNYVYEVAIGADETIRNEAEEFNEKMRNGQDFMTTSCCAGYNQFVEKHLPEIKEYKSNTQTPLFYTSQMVKEKHPNAKLIFISPCVAKKKEVQQNKNVDYVINVEELSSIFVALNIEISAFNGNKADDCASKQARNFCVTEGVSQAVNFYNKLENSKTVVINGINKDTIKQLKKYAYDRKCVDGNFVEVMCCEGGCINGNATISSQKDAKNTLNKLLEQSNDIK